MHSNSRNKLKTSAISLSRFFKGSTEQQRVLFVVSAIICRAHLVFGIHNVMLEFSMAQLAGTNPDLSKESEVILLSLCLALEMRFLKNLQYNGSVMIEALCYEIA